VRLPTVGRLRGFDRPVYLVAGARFVNTFGSGVVYPFATLYFVQVVGISFTLVGLGLLANNVATATGTLVGGYLADRYGRRPVMVASMALAAPESTARRERSELSPKLRSIANRVNSALMKAGVVRRDVAGRP